MTITPGKCTKCQTDTGAEWKTLCRSCWKKQTPEEIRAYRQAKIDRKVARLRKGADKRDEVADSKQAAFKENSKDWAYVTQPNINTTGGRAFSRQREKVLDRYDAGIRLQIEADDMREQAEYLEKTGAVVKGDAERKRQAERDARDKIFTVGSVVVDWSYGRGVIAKVNKKTYTIRFDSEFTATRDKSYIKLDG